MPNASAAPARIIPFPKQDVQINSVLVATDLSPASQKAERYAAAISRRYDSKFYLMNVVSSLGFTMVGPESATAATILALRDARQRERELVTCGLLEGLDHEVVVTCGDIWPEVRDAVCREKVDLVVVGTHSRHGVARLVLGSVAEEIFRHASCPVLTVGPNSPGNVESVLSDSARPLVFATDFSPESLAALPYAISIANRRNSALALLHVIPPVPDIHGTGWHAVDDISELRKDVEEATRRQLSELLSGTQLTRAPLCIAEPGFPIDTIAKTAVELHAMAIVLGLKPHGGVVSHLPWSTAYAIVCAAECPVLTVRG